MYKSGVDVSFQAMKYLICYCWGKMFSNHKSTCDIFFKKRAHLNYEIQSFHWWKWNSFILGVMPIILNFA